MFKVQVQELRDMVEVKELCITDLENELKNKKEELRDIKQALSSLERVQSKYEPQEVDEDVSVPL